MIKKIIEASKRYCKKIGCNRGDDAALIIDGFIKGANWAQEEFKKSLWHDASEEPVPHGEEKDKICPHARCVVEMTYGEYGVRQWNPTDKCWDDEEGDDYEYDMDWVKRWCYLDDILPQKGGEE